jgi:hypothetical protein
MLTGSPSHFADQDAIQDVPWQTRRCKQRHPWR